MPAPRLRPGLLPTLIAAAGIALFVTGCHTARILGPPPPLRAASASSYAVDVEFAEPLDRASAEDPSHYALVAVSGGAAAVIQSATLVDTLYGRVVQLLIPDWLTTNPDTTEFDLTTSGVIALDGRSTGSRTVRFATGLSYRAPVRALLGAHCSSCHGASRADGSYRTDSEAELVGGGRNATPNLIAGDPNSLLLVKCRPGNSMFNRGNLSFLDFEILLNWVVSYSARS